MHSMQPAAFHPLIMSTSCLGCTSVGLSFFNALDLQWPAPFAPLHPLLVGGCTDAALSILRPGRRPQPRADGAAAGGRPAAERTAAAAAAPSRGSPGRRRGAQRGGAPQGGRAVQRRLGGTAPAPGQMWGLILGFGAQKCGAAYVVTIAAAPWRRLRDRIWKSRSRPGRCVMPCWLYLDQEPWLCIALCQAQSSSRTDPNRAQNSAGLRPQVGWVSPKFRVRLKSSCGGVAPTSLAGLGQSCGPVQALAASRRASRADLAAPGKTGCSRSHKTYRATLTYL
jgi:hypothetical protein